MNFVRKVIISIAVMTAVWNAPAVYGASQPVLNPAEITMDGSGKVTFALGNYDDTWKENVSAVYVNQAVLDTGDYSISKSGLTVASRIFTEKRAVYEIRIEAAGYSEVSASIQVNNYGAEKFYVRLLDLSGNVKKTKTYTKEQMIQMSGTEDTYYQTVCGMRGITSFKARGIDLEELLKKSGVTFGPGMTLKLRTNDMARTGNDPAEEPAYYGRGVFTYEDLLGTPRYRFPDIYTDPNLKDNLLAAKAFDQNMRTILGNSKKEAVKPMVAYIYAENVWNDNPDEPVYNCEYNESTVSERAFRFLFGIAMNKENAGRIDSTVTTWSAAYTVFGIDIVDPGTVPSGTETKVPGTAKIKSAVSAGFQSIRLTWNKVSGASGYLLYRAPGKNKSYTQIQTIRSGNTLSYTDKGLTTGRTYYYKIRAFSGTGASTVKGNLSAAKSASPSLGKSVIRSAKRKTEKKAVIQWKKTAGADGYLIYRAESKNGNYRSVRTVRSGKQLKCTDTGLKKKKTYYYKVKPYRMVNGKKVKGSFSAARKVKAK